MTVLKGSRYNDDETSYLILKEDDSTGVERTEMSRVRPFRIEADPADTVYTVRQGDTWWSIAGLQAVYGDPGMYDVLMAANPSPDLFKGMFDGLNPGQELRVPPAGKIFERRGGRSSTSSVRDRPGTFG